MVVAHTGKTNNTAEVATVCETPPAGNRSGSFQSNCPSDLFYQAWVPSGPQLIVVGIHGAGQHSGWFGTLADCLFSQRMAFFALDLRGFGRSSGSRGHVDHFEQYLDDVDQFIHCIRKQLAPIPIILLGHSFGGTVAIRYVQERPTAIQALVLSSPALRIRMMIPPGLVFFITLLSRIAPAASIDLVKWPAIISRAHPHYRLNVPQRGNEGDPWNTTRFSVRWLTELLTNGTQALRWAHHLSIPVLSFCSEDDVLVDPWAVRQFYRALPGPDKQHLVLGHKPHDWILHDNGSDPLYAYVIDWMKAH